MAIFALLDTQDAVIRVRDFGAETPPTLAPAKGLRWVAVTGPQLAAFNVERRAALAAQLDDRVAEILARAERFYSGNVKREAAARAFKAGGYVGDPGVWVTSLAVAAGFSNTQAADAIISRADTQAADHEALEAQRMRRYAILGANTVAAAKLIFDDAMAQVNAIAAVGN